MYTNENDIGAISFSNYHDGVLLRLFVLDVVRILDCLLMHETNVANVDTCEI